MATKKKKYKTVLVTPQQYNIMIGATNRCRAYRLARRKKNPVPSTIIAGKLFIKVQREIKSKN